MQASAQAVQNTGNQKASRPLSPRVSVYRWRAPMLASFAHRLSGVVLVIFVPVYLCLLSGLTASADDFSSTLDWMHSSVGRLFLWLVGAALMYHLVNGIRFLLLDAGFAETKQTMQWSARFSLVAGVAGALLLAVYLW
ncbi:MAG: succinate dehydrogenase, cytochrome b556 subunit [Mariprofundaceae bacterium]|nr:succinate dehydrogenase, cytochrome b556 subunit [Mariprofundaceae bacterium]